MKYQALKESALKWMKKEDSIESYLAESEFCDGESGECEMDVMDWLFKTFPKEEDPGAEHEVHKVREYAKRWLERKGYDLTTPISEIDSEDLELLANQAKDILNPHEAPDLNAHLQGEKFTDTMESTAPKFESRMQDIWECISTDMLGNSQPTAGVFSGDNFASGDTRVPVPLGGYTRRGKIIKKRKFRHQK